MHSVKSASVFAGVLLAGTSLATGAALAANPVNWTGFYVGVQGGYSNLNSVETFGDSPTSAYTLGGNGASIGVFGGYDFQVGSMFVLGVDGEVNWENAATQDDTKLFGQPEDLETWSAAIRAKLGVVVSPSVLLFATAGYTEAGFDMSHGHYGFDGYDGTKWTGTGAQYGLGASTQLTDNLFGNVEVTYSSYGRHVLTGGFGDDSVDESVWSAKAGLAWKFPAGADDASTASPAGPAPAGDWTGFYLGAQGGYTNFNSSEDYANPSDQQDLYWTMNGNGVSVGAFGGYNYQLNNLFVLGVDGEVNWENAALNYDSANEGPYGLENWSAALRAKIGVVVNPQVMVFATAGYTMADFDYSKGYWLTDGDNWVASGAQVGVGATTKLTDNLLANFEVTYSQFATHRLPGFEWNVTPTNVSAKAGLAWKFQ